MESLNGRLQGLARTANLFQQSARCRGSKSKMDKEGEQAALKERLFALLKLPDNSVCCDCGEKNVEWVSGNNSLFSAHQHADQASSTLGIFLCVDCSGMHRKLSVDFSRVKSVRLDNWKDSEVDEMAARGNALSNKQYLARLVPHQDVYCFPKSSDGSIIREQWIR
jgi:hypothetical protein